MPSEFNENLPKDSEEYKRWKASREAGVSGAMAGLTVGEGGAAAGGEGGAPAAAAAAAPAPEKKQGSKKKKGGKPEVRRLAADEVRMPKVAASPALSAEPASPARVPGLPLG